jgi:hypothetical protein
VATLGSFEEVQAEADSVVVEVSEAVIRAGVSIMG